MARKTETKAKGKASAPTPEKRENRYPRAARILIETGEGVDLAELAIRADMSEPTASHCLEAFVGVTTALRDAKLLPVKAPAPKRVPSAPEKAQETPEPIAAA
jgi:hypothetical protein